MLNKLLEKFAPDSKFTEIWQNNKIRSIILLFLWVIFILIVYLGFILPNQKNDQPKNTINNEEVKKEDKNLQEFEELKYNLLKYNFDFKITFTENNIKTIYKGNAIDNQNILVYKESDSGLEEYYLKDNVLYKVSLGSLQETENIERPKYLDLNNIFNLIDGITPIELENKFIFEIDNVYVKIDVDEKNISSIQINENSNSYLLEFTSVGKIENINY